MWRIGSASTRQMSPTSFAVAFVKLMKTPELNGCKFPAEISISESLNVAPPSKDQRNVSLPLEVPLPSISIK